MSVQQSPYIEFCGISKAFPGVQALSNISFSCHAGQIHSLMGKTVPVNQRC